MMRMSPRILGLITCYILINVLSFAILTSVIHVSQIKYPIPKPVAQVAKSLLVSDRKQRIKQPVDGSKQFPISQDHLFSTEIQRNERNSERDLQFQTSWKNAFSGMARSFFTHRYPNNYDTKRPSVYHDFRTFGTPHPTRRPPNPQALTNNLLRVLKVDKIVQKPNTKEHINELKVGDSSDDVISGKPMQPQGLISSERHLHNEFQIKNTSDTMNPSSRTKVIHLRTSKSANEDTRAFMAELARHSDSLNLSIPGSVYSVDVMDVTSPATSTEIRFGDDIKITASLHGERMKRFLKPQTWIESYSSKIISEDIYTKNSKNDHLKAYIRRTNPIRIMSYISKFSTTKVQARKGDKISGLKYYSSQKRDTDGSLCTNIVKDANNQPEKQELQSNTLNKVKTDHKFKENQSNMLDIAHKSNVNKNSMIRRGRVLEQVKDEVDDQDGSNVKMIDFRTKETLVDILTEVPTTHAEITEITENTTISEVKGLPKVSIASNAQNSEAKSSSAKYEVIFHEIFPSLNDRPSNFVKENTSKVLFDNSTLSEYPNNQLERKESKNDSLLIEGNIGSKVPEYDLNAESSDTYQAMQVEPPRQPKMTDTHSTHHDSLSAERKLVTKKYHGKVRDDSYGIGFNHQQDSSYRVPEFRPGTFLHFPVTLHRQTVGNKRTTLPLPVLTAGQFDGKPPGYLLVLPNQGITHLDTILEPPLKGARVVASTFYPNRIQEVTLQFANRKVNTTGLPLVKDTGKHRISRPQGENDEDEEEDIKESDQGFTMEKLAYLLIGTCCGLSIICLLAVMAAIKCRRLLVERRLRSRFRRHKMYNHISPWHRHIYDQFMYIQNQQMGESCSSKDNCNCRCVTWSLGPRNLECRPICPPRSSVYLCGPKKLPFGAASTLRHESMLGRGRRNRIPPPPPPRVPLKSDESSNDNDSLNHSSDADRPETSPRQCTCIDPPWTIPDARRGSPCNTCPCSNRPTGSSGCPRRSTCGEDFNRIDGAFHGPPPVTGSDYLDRTEGVVYWSSNDERLI